MCVLRHDFIDVVFSPRRHAQRMRQSFVIFPKSCGSKLEVSSFSSSSGKPRRCSSCFSCCYDYFHVRCARIWLDCRVTSVPRWRSLPLMVSSNSCEDVAQNTTSWSKTLSSNSLMLYFLSCIHTVYKHLTCQRKNFGKFAIDRWDASINIYIFSPLLDDQKCTGRWSSGGQSRSSGVCRLWSNKCTKVNNQQCCSTAFFVLRRYLLLHFRYVVMSNPVEVLHCISINCYICDQETQSKICLPLFWRSWN